MKLIKRYPNQKYFNISQFLKKKGYKLTYEYHCFKANIQINHHWSEIWSLHLEDGEANYLLVKEKEAPYFVYIIDIEESLLTSEMVKEYLETGEEPIIDKFLDFIEESRL